MNFHVIPAIDLIGGRVVRLLQGERDRATTYSALPGQAARAFEQAGSQWLHVVNLDGAFDQGDSANQQALQEIVSGDVQVQFGGGLRSLEAMRAAFQTGVDRVVLGTIALKDPASLEQSLAEFGSHMVAVAVDLRAGRLQSHGWTEDVRMQLDQYLERLSSQGVEWIIYTDADRDGTGRGLAIDAARRAQAETGINTIVSGGVGGLEDIRAARRAGLAGVIVGKALHDGVFTIEEALVC